MIEFWYTALASKFGVVISTDDPERCRTRLYQARTKSADPALSGLSVVLPAIPGEVWIVKKEPTP